MNLIFSSILLILTISSILLFTKRISLKKAMPINLSMFSIFIILNLLFKTFDFRITSILLIFSISVGILKLLSKTINIFKNSNHLDDSKKLQFEKFKVNLFNYFFPIAIYIYQLLIIWNTNLQSQILNN